MFIMMERCEGKELMKVMWRFCQRMLLCHMLENLPNSFLFSCNFIFVSFSKNTLKSTVKNTILWL